MGGERHYGVKVGSIYSVRTAAGGERWVKVLELDSMDNNRCYVRYIDGSLSPNETRKEWITGGRHLGSKMVCEWIAGREVPDPDGELSDAAELQQLMGGYGECIHISRLRELWDEYSGDMEANWLVIDVGAIQNFCGWLASTLLYERKGE